MFHACRKAAEIKIRAIPNVCLPAEPLLGFKLNEEQQRHYLCVRMNRLANIFRITFLRVLL